MADHDTHEGLPTALYRHHKGLLYGLGLRCERLLWKQCEYQFMGPVSLIREQVAVMRRQGLRERSLVFYLLTDVEKEQQEA